MTSVHSLADEYVLRAPADVAYHATTPDKSTATSDRRRTSVLVVASSATHRIAVGLSESSYLHSSPPSPPDAAPTPRGGTVVKRLIDVDQLVPGYPSPVVSLLLPSSSPLSGPRRLVALDRPDERCTVAVEGGLQRRVVETQEAVADCTELGQLTPASLEDAATRYSVTLARHCHIVAHCLDTSTDTQVGQRSWCQLKAHMRLLISHR